MSNKMQEYYLLQAEVLQDVFAGEKDVLHAFSQKHKEASRLCIVGSGSSFYCAQIAAPFIRQNAGIAVLTMLPGRAEEFAPLPEDLMLLVTQEGKSVNVMRVADHLEALGKPFSVLTALTESPTALRAEDCLSMGCGEEKSGPKTKGVTSTLLMLQRLALELGLARGHLTQEAYQQKQEALAADLNAAHSMLEKSLEWVLQNEAFFTQAPFCAIISVAPLCFLAQEAALKLVETLYLPTVSYEFEEFIHGPHCLLGEGFHIVALYHGLPDEDRLRSLCAFAREKGCRVLEISDQAEADFDGLQLAPSKLEQGCPVHFLFPFQAASAYLAERMGHDLNRPKFDGFATRLKSKLY